jgi:hypothetical protein
LTPTEDQLKADFQALRSRTDTQWSDQQAFALELARLAREGSPGDGYKSTHGAAGVNGGGGLTIEGDTVPASSVEAAVLNEHRPADIDLQIRTYLAAVQQRAFYDRIITNTGNRIRLDLRAWTKPVGHQAPECKSVGCEGVAVARGWCDPCRKWISRNPSSDGLDPVTVPAEVIAERTRRRAKAS